jgi:radical SAM modification target selenobiotic family peptide
MLKNILTLSILRGKIIHKTYRRRHEMKQKDFKKILAGLSISALVAGVTLAGVGYPEPAQAA